MMMPQEEPGGRPFRKKVGVAEYAVGSGEVRLTTTGLGSCLGIALFDPEANVAGLAHVMLPEPDGDDDDDAAKFVTTGIACMLTELVAVGAEKSRVEAKLAGGSSMLEFASVDQPIGDRNVEAARRTLGEHGITVVGEDVGGGHGRSLELHAETGRLIVTSAHEGVTEL